MEKKETVKITKKIVGFKVVTPEEINTAFSSNPVEVLEDLGLIEVGSLETLKQYAEESVVTYLQQGETIQSIKQPLKRPLRLDNEWRLKPPYANHALYVRLNAIEHEGKKYPYEIFFNTKDVKDIKWLNALTVTISTAFRTAIETGTSLQPLIDNFKESCDTESPYLSRVPEKPRFVNGLVAEIGLVLEVFNKECLAWNYSESSHERPATATEVLAIYSNKQSLQEWAIDTMLPTKVVINPCPECGESMRVSEGCLVCSCGYSKCS